MLTCLYPAASSFDLAYATVWKIVGFSVKKSQNGLVKASGFTA
jgi:hypothetical protein